MDAQAKVRALYGVMQSLENKLGGGEGIEGLYGSVTKGGMQKVLTALRDKCGLDSNSRLVDIGAGLGRPLMHALVDPGIASGFGVEIDRIKCDKAAAFLRQALVELRRKGVVGPGDSQLQEPPSIQCAPIEQMKTLDPCTHAYSFWEGVPLDGKAAFGRLFAASRTLQAVAVVQRAMRGQQSPAEVMECLGFGELVLVDSFSVSMSGSGRSFTAYVFNRVEPPAALPTPLAAEQPVAEGVATPDHSVDLQAACSLASTASFPEGEVGREATEAAASGTALAGSGAAAPLQPPATAAREGEQVQQPSALGRGSRRAVSRRGEAERSAAPETSASRAGNGASMQTRSSRRNAAKGSEAHRGSNGGAEAQGANAGGAALASANASCGAAQQQKRASPQKPKGVQKRQSPRKAAPVLLQDARVRRPGAAMPSCMPGKGMRVPTKHATAAGGGTADQAQSPTRARRGLLA
ncbi:hypothetical protein N2152v2_008570 [Parachlorella kessleri]